MNKEKILITALLVMVFAGITIACEPTPPPTPEPNYTECNTTIPITNTNNNTNNNDISNNVTNNQDQNQTQNQNQDQTQNQNQNTTVILDNQNNNTNNNQNNQSNTLDVIFNPIINIFNYFNVTNTANPVFTNNPVITIAASNGQLLDVALDQETVQYGYNEQGQSQLMISKNIAFPSVLCKGAVTPYGTVLGVQEHNATISGENEPVTGYPIGGIVTGIALCVLGIIGAAKSGLLARFGW